MILNTETRKLLIQVAQKHNISFHTVKTIYEGMFKLSCDKMRTREVSKVSFYPLGYYEIKEEDEEVVKKYDVTEPKPVSISFSSILKKKDD